jgi:hypothetical protein
MAHVQQQILDAMQAVLAAGGTVAGSRVFVDRVDPLQADELPAILIEEDGSGETSEELTVGAIDRRELSVLVHCVLAHTSDAPAQAREFGLAVEKLIAPSAALAALASAGLRITSSRPVFSGDGDRLLASRQQSWVFSYFVRPESPDSFI